MPPISWPFIGPSWTAAFVNIPRPPKLLFLWLIKQTHSMPMIMYAFPHPKVQANLRNSIDSDQSSVGLTIMEFFSCFTVNCAWMLSHFSCVWLFETLWTVSHQSPLSKGFSRQEYWCGLPCPPPGDLPNPGIKPGSLALQADSLTFWATRKAYDWL